MPVISSFLTYWCSTWTIYKAFHANYCHEDTFLFTSAIFSTLLTYLQTLLSEKWNCILWGSLLFYTYDSLPGAGTRDPTHDKVMRRKPDRQGGSGFQGFRKAAPRAHLKDDICLSDACLSRLLPNFCDTGWRPSPVSSQIKINLEL